MAAAANSVVTWPTGGATGRDVGGARAISNRVAGHGTIFATEGQCEDEAEIGPAHEDLQGLRTPVCLAPEMGEGLGGCPVLLGPLPQDAHG